MSEIYNEFYYKTNNYENYLNKSDRYNKLALEIITFLNTIKLSYEDENFFDYGCAVGFFLDGLKKNGIKNTFGYDISEWALQNINKNDHKIISYDEIKINTFEITFFLDVLEHMSDRQIHDIFSKLKSNKILVRIPVGLKDEGDFVLEVSRRDKTHINCKTKNSWLDLFKRYGFKNFIKINLNNIYDSEGVFCALIYKEKLYE